MKTSNLEKRMRTGECFHNIRMKADYDRFLERIMNASASVAS